MFGQLKTFVLIKEAITMAFFRLLSCWIYPSLFLSRRRRVLREEKGQDPSLIFSTFEPLQGATVFSKLDLQNAYHLAWI